MPVFLCYLKASLSPIYTGGMNLPIYGSGMAELLCLAPRPGTELQRTMHSGELYAKCLLMQTCHLVM